MPQYFNTFEIMDQIKTGNIYEYGCLMVKLSILEWEFLLTKIDSSDLYQSENQRYGLEKDPHITIIYGLHDYVDDKDVIKKFIGLKRSDFDLEIGIVDCFYNEFYDVLKINIKSNVLRLLHQKSCELPNTQTFDDYRPHITLGYFKKGAADKYLNQNLDIDIDYIDKIVYSKVNGEKIDISIE